MSGGRSVAFVEQLSFSFELFDELLKATQGALLYLAVGVCHRCSSALNGVALLINAAVGMPQVSRDVDTIFIVSSDPSSRICRGDRSDQNKDFVVFEVFFIDPPGMVVELSVLGNYVGQSVSGTTATIC